MSKVPVEVKVQYDENKDEVSVAVYPWRRELEVADEVEWTVHGGTNAKIKGNGAWPFDAIPGSSPKVKPKPGTNPDPKKIYRYQISLQCESKNGQYEVVIDPEIIIKK